VLNLTGTVIHTNLGRAPLPAAAVDALRAAAGATDVEFDLARGGRGERDHHVEGLLRDLTGAEAAAVVNNNAAAVLLVLNTFAQGREVPVSRGELVEIGGAFRMPDVMARAGARLVEVGTTNRTRAADFEAAMGPETGMLMKVHPSNYEILGFTEETSIEDLAAVGRRHGVPVAWDLGSGSLVDLARFGLPREPMPQDGLRAGADLVTFSGDKLLGGPQAGLVVGDRDAVAAVRRNPLRRALRVDKLALAALAAVLRLWADPETAAETVPVLALLTRPLPRIRRTVEALVPVARAALGEDWIVEAADVHSQIGSGALPVDALPSCALRLAPRRGGARRTEALLAALRDGEPPVIGRIRDGAVLLDARTLEDPAPLAARLETLHAP
jgi:L-seryl-tRNA(Ser) seleniumtransferase